MSWSRGIRKKRRPPRGQELNADTYIEMALSGPCSPWTAEEIAFYRTCVERWPNRQAAAEHLAWWESEHADYMLLSNREER